MPFDSCNEMGSPAPLSKEPDWALLTPGHFTMASKLSIRDLEIVKEILDHGSISKAADSLGMTQSALTKALQRIESALDLRLFDRQPRGVEPTAYGRALENHANLIRRQFNDALAQLKAMAGGDTGEVKAGAGNTFLDGPLPIAIARLLGKRPNLRIQVLSESIEVMIERLKEGELDLVFSLLVDDLEAQKLSWISLITDDMNVVARSGHPLVSQAVVSLEQLLECGWVLGGKSDPNRRRLDKLFANNGLAAPEPVVEASSRALIVEILGRTDFLSLFPDVRFHTREEDGLSVVANAEASWRRSAGIIYRKDATLLPAVTMLMDEVKQVCDEYYGGGSDSIDGRLDFSDRAVRGKP